MNATGYSSCENTTRVNKKKTLKTDENVLFGNISMSCVVVNITCFGGVHQKEHLAEKKKKKRMKA